MKNLLVAAALGLATLTAPVATLVAPTIAVTGVAVAVFAPAQDAQAAAMADYLENKIIDHVFRATAYTAGANIFIGLSTSACSDSATGTEVSGGSYARVSVASGTTNWAGTQSAGSTAVSSGTGGTTSNNIAITFPAPTANWGSVSHVIFMDASSAGNILFCVALTVAKTVNNGDAAPSFATAALSMQIDN